MMKRLATGVALVAIVVCATPHPASAQTDYSGLHAQRSAEFSLFGGATASGTGGAAALGWSAGWRASSRVALQGGGTWMSQAGADGFAALFGARFYLNTTRRAASFLTLEGGLFHADVDTTDLRTPDFYLDRATGGFTEKVFNDFVVAGGGGLDVHLGGRIWLRPDARLLVVVDGWRANALLLGGAHVSYRFGGP